MRQSCNTGRTGRWVGAIICPPLSMAMEGADWENPPVGPGKAGPGVLSGPIYSFSGNNYHNP